MESVITVIVEELENPEHINRKFAALKQKIGESRLSLAEIDYKGKISFEALENINNETNVDLKESYESLVRRYHIRNKTGAM